MVLKSWAVAAAVLALSGAAQAALIDRGGGMVYDTVQDITWLTDTNFAFSSGYAAANAGGMSSATIFDDGRMGRSAADVWASGLVYGGFSDWRLPTLNPTDPSCTEGTRVGEGYNCTDGELGHLFVTDLGNLGHQSVLNQAGDTGEQQANWALFSNLQSAAYWSSTEDARFPGRSLVFSTVSGYVFSLGDDVPVYALAVRDGDVAAAVPEPQSLALALLALGATVVARRRRAV